MTFTLFIFIIAYTLTGMFVAKSWYQQRHGIHFKLINGGADALSSNHNKSIARGEKGYRGEVW